MSEMKEMFHRVNAAQREIASLRTALDAANKANAELQQRLKVCDGFTLADAQADAGFLKIGKRLIENDETITTLRARHAMLKAECELVRHIRALKEDIRAAGAATDEVESRVMVAMYGQIRHASELLVAARKATDDARAMEGWGE